METLSVKPEIVHLDTHVLVWAALQKHEHLSKGVIDHINNSVLIISPIVILELRFLIEAGKIEGNHFKIIEKFQALTGLEIAKDPFESVVKESLHLSWTRDPFDRLIVAQAAISKSRLLTKDREIRRHYSRAVWE